MTRLLLGALLALAAGCSATPPPTPTPEPTPERTVYFVENGSDSFAGDYINMPASSVSIEYAVYGTCAFGVKLFAEQSEEGNVSSPNLTITGPEQKGTWKLTIDPTERYGVGIGGDGCSWLVTIRDGS